MVTKTIIKYPRNSKSISQKRKKGGINARNQGLNPTCYAEAACRSIIKMFKKMGVISDFKTGILSDNLMREFSNDTQFKKDLDDFNAISEKIDGKCNMAQKTAFLDEHPVLKAMLVEQDHCYSALLNCISSRWGWSIGGNPEPIMIIIAGFIMNTEPANKFRDFIYGKVKKIEPRCKSNNTLFSEGNTNQAESHILEQVPAPLSKCKPGFSNNYFDIIGDLFVKLRTKLTESGLMLIVKHASVYNGNILENIPVIVKECIDGGLYPVISLTFNSRVFGLFQRTPEKLNSINDEFIENATPMFGGHSMVIIDLPNGNSITVKNSWGTDWGDCGKFTFTNHRAFVIGPNDKTRIDFSCFVIYSSDPESKMATTKTNDSTTRTSISRGVFRCNIL